MPYTENESLSERTIQTMQRVVQEAVNSVDGLERNVAGGAMRMLYPRLEQRIRNMPEDDLRRELTSLYKKLGTILHEPKDKESKPRRKRQQRSRKRSS